jgi:hypothetical protein
MIWEWSADFSEKENYRLTRREGRLENPRLGSLVEQDCPVKQSCVKNRDE